MGPALSGEAEGSKEADEAHPTEGEAEEEAVEVDEDVEAASGRNVASGCTA